MADFNLSALVNLQLSKNAAENLAKAIQKDVNKLVVKPQVKPILSKTGEFAKFFDKNSPKQIKVKLVADKKSTDALFKTRKIAVDFDIKNAQLKKLDSLAASLKKIVDQVNKLGGASTLSKVITTVKNSIANNSIGQIINTGPPKQSAAAQSKAKQKKLFDDQVKAFENLQKRISKFAGVKNAGGSFFPFADKELNDIVGKFKKIDTVVKRFGGVNNQPIKNLTSAIDEAYKSFKKLDDEAYRLNQKGLLDSKAIKGIDAAKKEITTLLKTLDASNIKAFSASTNSIISPILGTGRDARNDLKQYQSLITSIARERAKLVAEEGQGGSRVKAIDARLSRVQTMRAGGASLADIKADQGILNSQGQAVNAKAIDGAYKGAKKSLRGYMEEVRRSSLFTTDAANALGAGEKVKTLSRNSFKEIIGEKKSGGPNSKGNIDNILLRTKQEVTSLREEVKEYDRILKSLDTAEHSYGAQDLPRTVEMIKQARMEILKLASAGTNINDVNKTLNGLRAGFENLSNDERKIQRIIFSVDRLRASLDFGLNGQDIAGVGPLAEALEKRVSSIDPSKGFDERKVRADVAKDSYEIRSRDRLNKLYDTYTEKLRDAGSMYANGTRGQEAYTAALEKFEAASKSAVNGNKSVYHSLKEVENAYKLANNTAQISSEGGIFGTLAKGAGLATKRLIQFLVVARGLYSLQNYFFEAADAVLYLDTQFTKLEQIISKNGKGFENQKKEISSLEQHILKLGSSYGVATQEIAESADTLAQADIHGKDLQKLLEISTKARLGPTFESNIEITEAMIASMNQFNLSAHHMQDVIGGISTVSAKYPVEAEGITKAIRRAGGAFAAAKADGESYQDALGGFISAFTIIKGETREADETLATALRNVVIRLQKSNIQEYLRNNFKIDLLDQNGQFVGFTQSILAISDAVEKLGIKSGDPRFSELIEKIAGSRQYGRILPLVKNAGDIKKVFGDYKGGGDTLDKDVEIAFGSMENKMQRAKNAFVELFAEIERSTAIKALAESLVIIVNVMTKLVSQFDGLLGYLAITAIAARNIGSMWGTGKLIANYAAVGFGGNVRPMNASFGRKKEGGLLPGFGGGDRNPYLLEDGEYVLNKDATKGNIGFLDMLNSGKIKKAAGGTPGGVGGGGGGGIGGFLSGIIQKVFGFIDKAIPSGTSVSNQVDKTMSLQGLLKEMGIVADGVEDLVSEVQIVTNLQKNGMNLMGSFNNNTNRIKLDSMEGMNVDVIGHEVGHALDKGIPGLFKGLLGKERIQEQVKKVNNSSLYKKDQTTIDKEAKADFMSSFTAWIKSGRDDSKHTEKDAQSFKVLESRLDEKGIKFNPDYAKYAQKSGIQGVTSLSTFKQNEDSKQPITGSIFSKAGGAVSGFTKSAVEGAKNLKNSISGMQIASAASIVVGALGYLALTSKESSEYLQVFISGLSAAVATLSTLAMLQNPGAGILGGVSQSVLGKNVFQKPGNGGPLSGMMGGGYLTGGQVLKPTVAAGAGAVGKSGILGKIGSVAGKFNLIGIAVAAATAGLSSWTDAVKSSADKILETTTSEEDAVKALNKKKTADNYSRGLGVAGSAGTGAGLGGAIGSIVPVLGTAIGAAIGGVVGAGVGVWNNRKSDVNTDKFGMGMARSTANLNKFDKSYGTNANSDETNNSFVNAAKNIGGAGAGKLGDLFKLDEGQRGALKEQAERLKKSFDVATPFQQAGLLEAAKKSGVDIAKIFTNLEMKFDPIQAQAAVAFDKLFLFFSKMKTIVQNETDRLNEFDANNQVISNIAAGVAGEGFNGADIPSSVFDILKNGGQVNGIAGQQIDSQFKQFKKSSPLGATAAASERIGGRSIRLLSDQVSTGRLGIPQDKNKSGAENVTGALSQAFSASLAGAPPEIAAKMDEMFDTYLSAKQDELSSVLNGNNIDSEKLSGVVNGFAEVINQGGLDLFQKFTESNKQFKDQYDSIIKRRLEYENKVTDLLGNLIGNKKTLMELRNKASGKSDSSLTGAQAANIDQQKIGNLLRGTGLGGGASVDDIKGRYNALTLQDPTGSNPEIQGMKNNLLTTLESIAGGTEGLAAAVRNFDKAAEKAKVTADRLTGALLGSDDEYMDHIKGIMLYQQVMSAGNSTEALMRLSNGSESGKRGLNNYIGSDEDSKLGFQKKLGIGPQTSGASLRGVEGEMGKQDAANNALIDINKGLSANMGSLADSMMQNKVSFEQFAVNVNNFGNVMSTLNKSITEMPKEIAHTHTFTVAPIQVVFTGTDGLNKLNDSSKELVTSMVNAQIVKFANTLRADNKGLTINTVGMA